MGMSRREVIELLQDNLRVELSSADHDWHGEATKIKVSIRFGDELISTAEAPLRGLLTSERESAKAVELSDVEKDVHTEHCCSEHGCKYGKDETCPVSLGDKPQSFPCEFCGYERGDL